MRERAARLSSEPEGQETAPARADAAVLKVNRRSARVRIFGEKASVTFRSGDLWNVVPGHVVTLLFDKRWTWRGDSYAGGRMLNPRIEIERLGLTPLPLTGGELEDLRGAYEPFRNPDPYAPMWRRNTSKPRPCFEMDPIAWGELPGSDGESHPGGSRAA